MVVPSHRFIAFVGGPSAAQLEFTPAVGRMRGATLVGDVNGESGVHLMEATDDLAYLRYRYQIQWRDREYVDLHALRVDDESHLLRAEFVNNTDVDHRYVFVCYAGLRADTAVMPCGPWLGAEDYDELDLPAGEWLRAGRDGLRRLHTASPDLVDRRGVGHYATELGLQSHSGLIPTASTLRWTLPATQGKGAWYLRALVRGAEVVEVSLNGQALALHAAQTWYSCPSFERCKLRIEQDPGGAWALDGFVWVPDGMQPDDMLQRIAAPGQWKWQRDQGQQPMGVRAVHPSHPNCPMAMCSAHERPLAPPPYDQLRGQTQGGSGLVHMHHRNLVDMEARRRMVGDCLVSWGDHNNSFAVDGSMHHLGYILGPVRVPAGERRQADLALAAGPGLTDSTQALQRCRRVLAEADERWAQSQQQREAHNARWHGSSDEQRLQCMLAAYTAANVIYPMPKGKRMTRGYTPASDGKVRSPGIRACTPSV